MRSFKFYGYLLGLIIVLNGCDNKNKINLPQADPDNAGLKLPQSFGAIITADNLGNGRHLMWKLEN